MKLSLSRICLVVSLVLAFHTPLHASQIGDDVSDSDPDEVESDETTPMIDEQLVSQEEDDTDDDGLYQRNPNYESPSIDAVLGRNDTAVAKTIRRVARFLKKHQVKVYVCLGLYLIGRAVSFPTIRSRVLQPLYRGEYDETGKLVGTRWKTGEIATMMKLGGVFVMLLLYVAMTPENDDQDDSSSMLTTLLLGPQNRLAALLLHRLLRPNKDYNPAYIPSSQQHYTFELMNDRYSKDAKAMAKVTKKQYSSKTSTALNSTTANSTIVVLDWTGLDTTVSNLEVLKDSVSFLLSLDDDHFDIVVVLESPGGSASQYAMAAQQLCRLRQCHDITICVDTVAASGGYMIACAGTRIIASPFAILGSIGVVGQSVNVHKVLENWGVRPLVFRGGRDKAPLGLIGEVTDENVAKMQGLIDDTHRAFKRHVVENRPRLANTIEEIATGDVWFGYDAVEAGLIDSIGTSDDYLLGRMKAGVRVLRLEKIVRKGLFGAPTTAENSMKMAQQGLPQRLGAYLARTVVGHNVWKQISALSSKFALTANSRG